MFFQRMTKDLGRDEWRTVAGVAVREMVGGDYNFGDKTPDTEIKLRFPTLKKIPGTGLLPLRLKASSPVYSGDR